MKKINTIIYSLCLVLFWSSFKDASLNEPTHLGAVVYGTVIEEDKKSLLKLLITKHEFYNEITGKEIPDSVKNKLIIEFEIDTIKEKENLIKGYNELINDKRNYGIKMDTIIANTRLLQKLNIQLGELLIQYTSGQRKKEVSMKIIQINGAWRILEKFKIKVLTAAK